MLASGAKDPLTLLPFRTRQVTTNVFVCCITTADYLQPVASKVILGMEYTTPRDRQDRRIFYVHESIKFELFLDEDYVVSFLPDGLPSGENCL